MIEFLMTYGANILIIFASIIGYIIIVFLARDLFVWQLQKHYPDSNEIDRQLMEFVAGFWPVSLPVYGCWVIACSIYNYTVDAVVRNLKCG